MERIGLLLFMMSMSNAAIPDTAGLRHMSARFAPTEMRVDVSGLSNGDTQALAKLIAAAKIYDGIFLAQRWSGNRALYEKLKRDTSPLGKARLHYFRLNQGPWSELDDHAAFLPGVPPKQLPGANFYPEDMTKTEFESWIKTVPPSQREAATGFFTVIRRDNKGHLKLVP